ncbi:MAG: sulfatase-like hydrolase/transferase [Prevotellaceae bacterium]|jgi:membrane-anchored protein YejM (alkaline phosphatase superfamily)|nr:sulfatase-like hydrolase/transferase [Prevotellaceae bacterium]
MLKFILIALCIITTSILSGKIACGMFAIVELLIIVNATQLIAKRYKKIAYIFNTFFSLILLLQQGSIIFSGDYISVMMFENLGEYNALGTSLAKYVVSALCALCLSLLPHRVSFKLLSKKYFWCVLVIFILISATIYKISAKQYPPCFSFVATVGSFCKSQALSYYYKNASSAQLFKEFHKNKIEESEFSINQYVGNMPNVIVIFTEGMSAEVIDKFNSLKLNLTPNLDDFYEKSLVFTNYYNHTVATYRGLRGQLFSSHQYLGGYYAENNGFGQMDKDTLLKKTATKIVSIIDILNDNDYFTFFINCEQKGSAHCNYLETFRCTKVISGATQNTLSDKEAFALLADTIARLPQPFFCGFYNLGTHAGFDSDTKYKDGKNAVYNKFYNFDKCFGEFFNQFINSNLAINTILIFTTDHCSFQAPEYLSAFSSKQDCFVNKIPLMIYGNGIEHNIIDVKGRNSLDLAPTILDLLKMNNHENYFLGSSLFIPDDDVLHRITAIGDDFYLTANDTIINISKKNNINISKIKTYYKISVGN